MTGSFDEMRFLAELGQRLRTLRALRGMSRKTLAHVSGLSERYIAQMESGQGNVSILLMLRLTRAMGTRLDDALPHPQDHPDWLLIRDLLQRATPAQVAEVKRLLSAASEQPPAAPRVALIGLRGAGKSTLGHIVADRLGWQFVELNREIERETGLAVAEIFALYGQEGYRRLEQTALQHLIARPGPLLLATAGGIVAEPVTYDLLLGSFHTIWLRAEPDEHMQRVREQGDLRPMGEDLSAMDELKAILLSREPLYARAERIVDTAGLEIEDAAALLQRAVEEFAVEKQPA
jgi:XRE family aerobic/anaerobic benzoate catabolism transcriptional regulator